MNYTQIADYKVNRHLGQGAYAIVKEGVHKQTNETVAVKIYEKFKLVEAQRKKSVIREISIMKKLQHPNIAALFDAIDTQRQLYLIMECVSGQSLSTFVKQREGRKLPENEACFFFRQLVSALRYVHNKNVSHRDVKLENILITRENQLKLIDFGFAACSKDRLRIFCGTPSYMAPEIVQKKDYFGDKSDIWACGILFFVLVCGGFPFKSSFEKDLFRKIQKGAFTCPDDTSYGFKELIKNILQVDPEKRASADQIYDNSWLAQQAASFKPSN